MLRGGSVSNTVLAIEAQGSEFRAQHPPEKPGVAPEVFVTPALWGEETGGLLGLAGHQPGKNPQSSRFGEILYLKRNKAKSKEGREGHLEREQESEGTREQESERVRERNVILFKTPR